MLNEIGTITTLREVIITIVISSLLGLMISYTYTKTYKGRFYSQTFAQTLIIVGIVISIIIVAIGSNIARAFSLAGALSIIRFRSTIGDPRDIAFIFFVLGAGLASGAGLFIPAIVFVAMLCALIFILYHLDYGAKKEKQKILKIMVPENLNFEGLFDDLLQQHLKEFSLMSIRTTNLGTMFELMYSIKTKEETEEKVLMDDIRARNGNLNVVILLDEQLLDI
ncbi:cell division protein FtsZ [Clostridium aceticum]|nr:cell division protein FtsZ [Clostridium aceticum]